METLAKPFCLSVCTSFKERLSVAVIILDSIFVTIKVSGNSYPTKKHFSLKPERDLGLPGAVIYFYLA